MSGTCRCADFSLSHRFGRITSRGHQPGIALGIETRVIGIQIDKATLHQEAADFENVTPPSGMSDSGTPRAILVHTGARPFHRAG